MSQFIIFLVAGYHTVDLALMASVRKAQVRKSRVHTCMASCSTVGTAPCENRAPSDAVRSVMLRKSDGFLLASTAKCLCTQIGKNPNRTLGTALKHYSSAVCETPVIISIDDTEDITRLLQHRNLSQ
ncbi:hypothetical protein DV515_00005000 [Chloebia gouldiae]|uniref:Uncharacterized protein n=1 Tax=Chloebia gouldiae TaxID=44316 RepID=A0A3L8SQU2_CHLGU|nr:hypothetical protein DV515_00005000 [Chloebia gouldiae]